MEHISFPATPDSGRKAGGHEQRRGGGPHVSQACRTSRWPALRRRCALDDERGLSTVEYAVIFAVILVAALAFWRVLGRDLVCRTQAGSARVAAELEGGESSSVWSVCVPARGSGKLEKEPDAGTRSRAVSARADLDSAPPSIATTTAMGSAATGGLSSPVPQPAGPGAAQEPDKGSTLAESHSRMREAAWTKSASMKKQLENAEAEFQEIKNGWGPYVYDEYSVLVTEMPKGVTPEAYLAKMATDLNGTIKNSDFDDVNTFHRRQSGAPQVGEVIDIDIWGPENGSVALVEKSPTHFTFQTIKSEKTGSHPEYGAREFGFERVEGGVRFYTRGVSRPENPVGDAIGSGFQKKGWTSLVTGISNDIQRGGGKSDPSSIKTSKELKTEPE